MGTERCVRQGEADLTLHFHQRPEGIYHHIGDYLVPAAKIADMATGWLAGQAARDFTATDDKMLDRFDIEQSEEFKTTKYFCKTHFDMQKIKEEEEHYVPLPKIYEFKNDREKEVLLNRNFKRVNQEVENMVKELLGMS